MKNDTYYFSHDSNAKDDPKCVMLIEQLGCEGYGIFWILIETLRAQPDYKYPLNLVGALARRYNTSSEKMTTVVKSYGLFKIEEDQFFSLRLMRAMDEYNAKRMKYIEAGSKGGQASVKHRLSNGQAIKGNKRKGNEKKKDTGRSVPVGSFYEKEIADNTGHAMIEKYKSVVDYLKGKNPDEVVFNNVFSMRDQLSFKQYLRLREKGKTTGQDVFDILKGMENKKDIAKKNDSVYLTAINWINLRVTKTA